MTPDQIRERIVEIERVGYAEGDAEVAHALEDKLHRDVLWAIAQGTLRTKAAREAAELALTTESIPFPRWAA